jgi:hypothetical protein
MSLSRGGRVRVQRHLWAAVLCSLILAWRFVQIRNLALPAWVDSVSHALLVRILLEQGKIPDTWGPYLPHVPFYYHFGFHLSAAAFAGLTGINVGRAVLLAGQVWQAVLALGIYTLGCVLWRERNKALIAMILVGFVSRMPAYYTTWGRYTLLAGLALLTMAMAAALAGRMMILAMLVAAIAVTHYYAFCLLVLFLAILMTTKAEKRRNILLGGLSGVLVASPWLWKVFVYNRRSVRLQVGVKSIGYQPGYLWYLLGPYHNYILLALALGGIVIVVSRLLRGYDPDQSGRFSVLVWTLAVVGLMGPWRVATFSPHDAAMILFLPVVLLAAEGLWQLRWSVAIWGMVLILVLWGMWETKDIIRPETVLATADDVVALEWIEANVSPEAIFLIDVAPWKSTVWRGVDGGYWIMPLTGRRTVLPSSVYAMGGSKLMKEIRVIAERIYALGQIKEPGYCRILALLMQETEATHYYTRSRRPEQCPTVRPLYQGQGGIAIYELGVTR